MQVNARAGSQRTSQHYAARILLYTQNHQAHHRFRTNNIRFLLWYEAGPCSGSMNRDNRASNSLGIVRGSSADEDSLIIQSDRRMARQGAGNIMHASYRCNEYTGLDDRLLSSNGSSFMNEHPAGISLSSANLVARYTAHRSVNQPPGPRVLDKFQADLPRRAPNYSTGIHNSVEPEIPRKKVDFTEFSSLRTYLPGPLYKKSYTKEDRGRFRVEAISEALRIKGRLTRAPGLSVKDSMKRLLREGSLTLDEFVGLESLIFNQRLDAASRNRRDHMRAVLEKQRELRGLPMAEKLRGLREFSASRSARSTKHAMLRAGVVAASVHP